jgi:uncharacterized protein (DUF169 family)
MKINPASSGEPGSGTDYSEKLRNTLELEGSPVAVTITRGRPEYLDNPHTGTTICRMIQNARRGNTFYASGGNILCGAGEFLGIGKSWVHRMDNVLLSSEKFFSSKDAARKMIDRVKLKAPEQGEYILFSPLESAEFVPDVVLIAGVPAQISRMLYLDAFETGEFNVEICEPLCSGVIAVPISTGKIGVSFMDVACRMLGGYRSDEMVIGIPYDRLVRLVENIDRSSAGTAKLSPQFRMAAGLLRKGFGSGGG